jgi:acyl carrier protein
LGEIEALLHQQYGVRHAVALVRPDHSGEPALFAWVAGLPGIDTNFLLDRLREALPNYMVPSAIIHVETFPVSPNGKIDRQALPLPRHPSSAQPSLVGARTETEVAIAAIWADVLKREAIGVEDTFFSVGGNSLQAAQVISRIRRHFSLDLPLRWLYERPTVALLASEVDRARSTAETKSLSA